MKEGSGGNQATSQLRSQTHSNRFDRSFVESTPTRWRLTILKRGQDYDYDYDYDYD
jgi:hypothetical protein